MTVIHPLAPAAVVPPPTVTPPLGSLVASAQPAPDDGTDRWQMGFIYWPENCVNAFGWDPNCDDTSSNPDQLGDPSGGVGGDKSAAVTNIEPQAYFPVVYESAFSCDATGWQALDFAGRASRQIVSALPNALEHEFWTGTIKPYNYNLVGNTPVQALGDEPGEFGGILNASASGSWTAMRPQDALALLVGALASCGPGSRGMIHAPAQIAELWAESQALAVDGPRMTTRTRGNVVVGGGGYPGTGPAGLAGTDAEAQASPGPGLAWCYATDMVVVRQGEPNVLPGSLEEARTLDPGTGRPTDQITYRGEQVAAAYCGTCCTFAVLVDTTDQT